MNRICAKNRCIEGEERSFGLVTFNDLKKNGNNYVSCDHCRRENHKRRIQINKGIKFKHFNKFPTPENYIYFIYNVLTNEIVYIGKSTGGPSRIYKHLSGVKTTAKQFWKIGKNSLLTKNELIDFWYFTKECKVKDQDLLEQFYINKYKPILNEKTNF